MESKNTKYLRAIVFGATGAVGRELVDHLMNSDKWTSVTVVTRRKIDRWDKFTNDQKLKFHFIEKENLDFLNSSSEELKTVFTESHYSTVFCCLGSRVGKGDEEFKKVDYTYVVYTAELCEKLNIPHFSLISAGGADSKSWFLYMRTKGQAEDEVMKKNIEQISILRPGLIKNRDNDSRFGEKVASIIPFIPKIESVDLAKAQMNDATKFHLNINKGVKVIYPHKEIEQMVEMKI